MVLVAAGRDAPAPPSPPAASLSARRQRRPLIARRGGTGRNGAGPGDAGAPGPPATPPPAGNVTGSAAPSGAPRRSKPAPGACRAAAEGGYTGTQSWLQGGIVTGTRDWVSRTQPHDCQRRGRSSSLAVNPWLWMQQQCCSAIPGIPFLPHPHGILLASARGYCPAPHIGGSGNHHGGGWAS